MGAPRFQAWGTDSNANDVRNPDPSPALERTGHPPEMNRFETEILTTRKFLKSLMDVPGKWIDRVRQHRSLDKLILDLNSLVSETYGRRERQS